MQRRGPLPRQGADSFPYSTAGRSFAGRSPLVARKAEKGLESSQTAGAAQSRFLPIHRTIPAI